MILISTTCRLKQSLLQCCLKDGVDHEHSLPWEGILEIWSLERKLHFCFLKKMFFDHFKIVLFILFWELIPSIIIIFINDKYFLFGEMLCGCCVIQEFSKAHRINCQTSVNPFWDSILILWFCCSTQVGIAQRLRSVGAETAACGWEEKLPAPASLTGLVP